MEHHPTKLHALVGQTTGPSQVVALHVNEGRSGKAPIEEGACGKGYAICPCNLLLLTVPVSFLTTGSCHPTPVPSSLKTLAPISNPFLIVNDLSSLINCPSHASATCSLPSRDLMTILSSTVPSSYLNSCYQE